MAAMVSLEFVVGSSCFSFGPAATPAVLFQYRKPNAAIEAVIVALFATLGQKKTWSSILDLNPHGISMMENEPWAAAMNGYAAHVIAHHVRRG